MDRYKILVQPDEDAFLVLCPAFEDFITDADSIEEAPRRAARALLAVIDGRMDLRRSIPKPDDLTGYDGPVVTLPAVPALKVRLYDAMAASGITRTEMAARLRVDPVHVRRLLDVTKSSKLESLEAAFAALGGTLQIAVCLPKAA